MQFRYLQAEWNDIYKSEVYGKEPCRVVLGGQSYWRPRTNEIGLDRHAPCKHAHLAHEIGHKMCLAAATRVKEWQLFILEIYAWDYALARVPSLPTSYREKRRWYGLISYASVMKEEYGQEGWDLAKQAVTALLEKHGQAWNPAWDKIR